MEMQFKLTSISDKELQKLEDKNNIIIPDSYRKFLLEDSGGQPQQNNFYKELETGGIFNFDIDAFLGISDNLSFDLFHTYNIMLGVVPSEVLVIADDGVGNKICIGMADEVLGKIYIWWAENENSENEKPNLESIEMVADSFSEFTSYLR